MIRSILLLMLVLSAMPVHSDTPVTASKTTSADSAEKKGWWQLRGEREDIFYPHKIHMQTMKQQGDSCMLCHPFASNVIHNNKKILAELTTINNEPLKAICHDCHVDKTNAPTECRLCHPDPATIWPQNHNYDYKTGHATDALLDQTACNECHKQLSFCTDCHFKRDYTSSRVHKLGYRNMHGLDARIAPAQCGSCHQPDYCSDCHRMIK